MQELQKALHEALEREAATREILRVISRSPGDYQPVFEVILENACRLCEAPLGFLYLVQGDGLSSVAERGGRPEFLEFLKHNRTPLDPDKSYAAQALHDCTPVQREDIANDPMYADRPAFAEAIANEGVRTFLAVPLHRGSEPVGAIILYRREVRPFEDKHIELVSTFADQAVIAIENVRLFQALEARTEDLGESLEYQTATSEILRTISGSPTDYQPVFDAILDNATRLCDAPLAVLFMRREDAIHLVAHAGTRREFVEYLQNHPLTLDPETSMTARVMAECAPRQVEDIASGQIYRERINPAITVAVEKEGIRTALYLPLHKDGESVGALVLYRREVRLFEDKHIELVTTFADQAVIAIENVRLFQALEARTEDLGESLEYQTATSDILRTISGSPTDYQPVFDVILDHATRLCDAPLAMLFMRHEDGLHIVAHKGARPEYVEFMQTDPLPLDPNQSATARAMAETRPMQVDDLADDQLYRDRQPHRVKSVEIEGIRTSLSVPLHKDGNAAVGVIVLYRREVRPFEDKHIELVSTFADQAVIAVENVRLFQALENRTDELGEALEYQTATSEILRVISGSPTDYQPVFDAVLENACRLCEAPLGMLFLGRDDGLHSVATRGARPELIEFLKHNPLPLDPDKSLSARAMLECVPVQSENLSSEPIYRDRPPFVTAVQNEGIRTFVAVPMRKDGKSIGVIGLYRRDIRPFEDKHIELVTTFADQAVIAIENVRLFQALEARTDELTESLEYQTATSDILRTISGSPTDYQPVFDVILDHATRLCDAPLAFLCMPRGDELHLVAHTGAREKWVEFMQANPLPLDPEYSMTARAMAECVPLQSDDLADDKLYEDRQPHRVVAVEIEGIRTSLMLPLHKDGESVGVIILYRREVRPFEDKHIELVSTFADQAVIAVENVRLFQALEARTDDLGEALERQTATSEILRVISGSHTDYQPVFEAILDNATRLCDAPLALLYLRRGEQLEVVATRGGLPEFIEFVNSNPLPLRPELNLSARALAEGLPVQCENMAEDSLYQDRQPHRVAAVEIEGIQTMLAVPMLKDDDGLGTIVVYRHEVRPFDDKITELLSTFADQAVIAIENVRLFQALEGRTHDLGEALEYQTATSEILRTISRSPTDYQPVFEAILDSATRLCDAPIAVLLMRREDGFHPVAHKGARREFVEFIQAHPVPLDPELTIAARAAHERVPVQSEDMANEPVDRSSQPHRVVSVETEGIRTFLGVPLYKDENSFGVIMLYRREVRPFEDKHIELVSTFADQAVIAIENVRLFQALDARTHDLGEALERQTATSEILRTISRSPTDYQPVFDAILDNAIRLCDAPLALLAMRHEDRFHLVAHKGARPEFVEFFRANPVPLDPELTLSARAAHERVPLQCADYLEDGNYRAGQPNVVAAVEIEGIRSFLAVPMVKNDESIGIIAIYRREVRPFDDSHIALISTFADQAVIAIDNVRMFQTLDERTRELTRSVGELRALGEVGQVVSSTLDLETVLTTIINQAVALSGTDGGAISEYDEHTGTLPLRAAPGFADLIRAGETPRPGEGAMGRAVETRAPVQIPDVDAPGAYTERLRPLLQKSGLKALLAVPLLREDRVLGSLLVARRTPGEFPDDTVTLLGTFAAQSAIAIHNARLFREIEEKGRELEAANRHKSEFLANMSHELRTPLNAVIGFSEVLADEMFGELNEKQSEYVDDIHSSGRHLLSLINDILDLSKIEAGHMELDLSHFELRPALDNALTLVGERASRRRIELEKNIEDNLGEMTGDERKLKQILLNLLSNAIKFTPEEGTVTLAARRDNGTVHIAVRDTGVGISAQDQTVIFDEFRQVGTDYARKVEGTGLGLTLTRRFVELHGGEIDVESTVGKGSEFRIVLPVEPPASANAATDSQE